LGKYDLLADFLNSQTADHVQLSFRRIENIIGDRLPASARKYPAWWANDRTHIHARVWLEAGWQTESVNLGREDISFRRM